MSQPASIPPPGADLSPAKGLLAVVSAFVLAQVLGGLGLVGAVALMIVTGDASIRDLSREATIRALMLRPLPVGASLIGSQIGLALTTYAFTRMGRLSFFEAVGLRRGEPRTRAIDVLLGVLLVLALGPLADAAAVLVARTFPGFTLGTIDMIGDIMRGPPLTALLIGLLVALAPGFAEEVLFRGVLLRALLRRYGPAVAIVASSVLFGAIHVDPPQGTAAAVLGLALGVVTYRTGSLWPAMAGHAANNAASVLFARFSEPKPLSDLMIDGWVILGSVVVSGLLTTAVFLTTRDRHIQPSVIATR